jgi:hypothetical protein
MKNVVVVFALGLITLIQLVNYQANHQILDVNKTRRTQTDTCEHIARFESDIACNESMPMTSTAMDLLCCKSTTRNLDDLRHAA